MYHSIKNTQECSPNIIITSMSSASTSAPLCKAAAHQPSLPLVSLTLLPWMKGFQGQKSHLLCFVSFANCIEARSGFNLLCIWLLVLFIQRFYSGKILSWHQKWDQFIKSTHNYGTCWRQRSCQPQNESILKNAICLKSFHSWNLSQFNGLLGSIIWKGTKKILSFLIDDLQELRLHHFTPFTSETVLEKYMQLLVTSIRHFKVITSMSLGCLLPAIQPSYSIFREEQHFLPRAYQLFWLI